MRSKEDALELRDKTLNAKGETIYEKPSFAQNILSRRCLLPVSGFFEWRDFNNNKYPYYIEPTTNPGFLLGSVFDTWVDKSTGELYDTFSIVTTPANPLMEMIHNAKKRMPLILDVEAADKWINPLSTTEDIKSIILPYNEGNMKAHTISKVVGNSKEDRNYPEIIQQVNYPELNQQSLF